MKKSPKENPAISGQKRPKPARSGHEKLAQETSAEPERRNPTSSQHQALVALLEERSLVAAARRTGIGERTLRRWLYDNPDFRGNGRRGNGRQVRNWPCVACTGSH
jgi:hypothetical protein